MNSSEIVRKAKDIAGVKTIYVRKAAGQKMTQANKLKFSSNDPFNAKRTSVIFGVTEDVAGYDELGLIAAITGQKFKDLGEVMSKCSDISKNFSNIVPGEIIFGGDTCGIYVGDNEIVYANAISGVIKVRVDGWISHGKLEGVDYERIEVGKEEKEDGERSVLRATADEEKEPVEQPNKAPERTERHVEVRPDRAGRRH